MMFHYISSNLGCLPVWKMILQDITLSDAGLQYFFPLDWNWLRWPTPLCQGQVSLSTKWCMLRFYELSTLSNQLRLCPRLACTAGQCRGTRREDRNRGEPGCSSRLLAFWSAFPPIPGPKSQETNSIEGLGHSERLCMLPHSRLSLGTRVERDLEKGAPAAEFCTWS